MNMNVLEERSIMVRKVPVCVCVCVTKGRQICLSIIVSFYYYTVKVTQRRSLHETSAVYPVACYYSNSLRLRGL